MLPGSSRRGRILFPVLLCVFCLASAAAGNAQPATTQGWAFGLGTGAATVSFGSDPGDGAALVGFWIGYGLNRIVTPYLGGAYADIRSRGLEAFDRSTFSHVDLGVRLHLAGRRRWVPYGDLALTFWRISDVLRNGHRTTIDFTSVPTLSVGGGIAIYLSKSWALDLNVKAAGGAFSGAALPLDAASSRLGVGLAWWPSATHRKPGP